MIKSYEIKNSFLSCKLLNYGATIADIVFQDRHIALRFDDIENYDHSRQLNQAFGSTVGRVANRIENAKFFLNNQEYKLHQNDGTNCLHGGERGFANQIWNLIEHTNTRIVFELNSPHLDQGFPGQLTVQASFRLEDNNLLIEYSAKLDPHQDDLQTVVNLTNHTYFNLGGCEAAEQANSTTETILNHELYSPDSRAILELSPNQIPTKRLIDLKDPVLRIDKRPIRLEDGCKKGFYDHSFVLETDASKYKKIDHKLKDKPNAYLLNRSTDTLLTLTTDNFSFHVYTGPRNRVLNYAPLTGVCLEAQSFTNCCNVPEWLEQCLVSKERPYSRTIRFGFDKLSEYRQKYGLDV